MGTVDRLDYHLGGTHAGAYVPMVLLAVGYVVIGVYLGLILNYDFLDSDVLDYWRNSLAWQQLFHRFHVPGYPLAIALVRAVSFGKLPPVLLMMAINLVALLAGAWLVYRMIRGAGIPENLAVMGACLFGLWPFVGLVYTVYPIADVPAMALLLAGLFALQNHRTRTAALLFGLSLIVHKAMWVFVASILMAELHQRKHARREAAALPLVILPVSILWLLGSLYHGSPVWMFTSNLTVEVVPRGTLPVLDGIAGTMLHGGVKGLVKGGLIAAFAVTALVSAVLSYRLKPPCFRYGIALSVACLFLFVALNQFTIWAAVRFSRLLVLPLIWVTGAAIPDAQRRCGRRIPIRLNAPVSALVLAAFFATQLVFSWYLARIYPMGIDDG